MAEKIISPGVFTTEIDQTFLPAAIGEIGAAVVGPTVKGPALVPTVVESFAEFEAKFGTTFKSGSDTTQYLTSHFAENYLKHGGKLTVVRILDGNFSEATSSVGNGQTETTIGSGSVSVGVLNASAFPLGVYSNEQITIGGVDFVFVSGSGDGLTGQVEIDSIYNDSISSELYVHSSSTAALTAVNLAAKINSSSLELNASVGGGSGVDYTHVVNFSGSGATYSFASSSQAGHNLMFGNHALGSADENVSSSMAGSTSTTAGTTSFVLHTHADGAVMNNWTSGTIAGTNSALFSGSADNLRWEIASKNDAKGTFNLLIRAGNDTVKRKSTLESWNNLSLDPNAKNYIARVIGDSKQVYKSDGTDGYLEQSGSFPNKSKYVWVDVKTKTTDYLDENGKVRIASASSSLPSVGSGSSNGVFGGGSNGRAGFDSLGNFDGANTTANQYLFYDKIDSTYYAGYEPGNTTNTDRGYSSYNEALTLLNNSDEYDINLIALPGVTQDNASAVIQKAIDVAEDRGDCFVLSDPTNYGSTISQATTNADSYDSNYSAMYYPWVQINDNKTGMFRWVPPSVVMGGIYAFNDKVAHPWFAPAGLNRGGIETAIQAERKLTHANRDTLYDAGVNPIATFPGQGVTVWGQKTLQKKASALDRINVRRLLIKVKKFIASSSRFLVFEQNNEATRKRFLNMANPYLNQVQSNSGLNAFRVVMDDTNNGPDVVDRNQLYGQLFLQPTRTAEFIVLDFTIQPTGATFPE